MRRCGDSPLQLIERRDRMRAGGLRRFGDARRIGKLALAAAEFLVMDAARDDDRIDAGSIGLADDILVQPHGYGLPPRLTIIA